MQRAMVLIAASPNCNHLIPTPWTDLHAVRTFVHMLGWVQREQQARLDAGATAVDVRLSQPSGRFRRLSCGVVRQGCAMAEDKHAGAEKRCPPWLCCIYRVQCPADSTSTL